MTEKKNTETLHDYVRKETNYLDVGTKEYEEAVYYAIYEWLKRYNIKDEDQLDQQAKGTMQFYGYELEDFELVVETEVFVAYKEYDFEDYGKDIIAVCKTREIAVEFIVADIENFEDHYDIDDNEEMITDNWEYEAGNDYCMWGVEKFVVREKGIK